MSRYQPCDPKPFPFLYSPHFIGHDAALEVSALPRNTFVHKPDAFPLMWPQNIPQQGIDHDVNLNLPRIGLQLIVFRQLFRRVQHQGITSERVMKCPSSSGTFHSQATGRMFRNIVGNRNLEGPGQDFLDHQLVLGGGNLGRGWSPVLDFVLRTVATFPGAFVGQRNGTLEGGVHWSEGQALTWCGAFALKAGICLNY